MTNTTNTLADIPDLRVDSRLLPLSLLSRDNARRVRHYKIALNKAMQSCLSPAQREQIRMHYWQGMNKSAIARLQGIGCSAVSKSIKAGQAAIRTYIEQYMQVYDVLEQELVEE